MIIHTLSFYLAFTFFAIALPSLMGGCSAYAWSQRFPSSADSRPLLWGARACGALPMLLGSGILAGWCWVPSPTWILLGALTVWIGIGCFCAGLVLLRAFQRDTDGPGMGGGTLVLLLANFPVALLYAWEGYRTNIVGIHG